ncbi:hypothetical protein ACFYYH_30965 [Streptomyces sp. NPDC002018]|uniref:hypothetical protein n=1 Tax=Streptomyces sp. NPDC002018 TaxID=3364629 RepID=UPI0036B59853
MNLRMIGLAAAAVFTVLLPLAAAEWSGPTDPRDRHADAKPDAGVRSLSGIDGSAARGSGTDGPAVTGGTTGGDTKKPAAERCGPEVASPEGIEARTCVLTEGTDTWARTAYRNTSGDELRAALNLMGPRGRTVQTHCVVGASEELATCQTPREPSRGAIAEYTAIVEFAAPPTTRSGGDDEAIGPLLLRSGSNS